MYSHVKETLQLEHKLAVEILLVKIPAKQPCSCRRNSAQILDIGPVLGGV
jgi:hypothetical protein